ncbi:MAG: hypothetical protein QNJ36_15200 [Calothrix sp. MO_167.B42]|nr:hypothetical protein [Calothrix sp. MO_167.B42]
MSNYDLLVGLNQDRLNLISQQVYSSDTLKQSLFVGGESGQYSGMSYTLNWVIASPLTLSLRSPTSDEWQKTIKEDGNRVAPQSGAFIVDIQKLSLKLNTSADTQDLDTTIPVQAICTARASGNSLTINALAVIVNLSQSTELDRFVISKVLIPALLRVLNKTLAGIQLPQLSFSGISLTPPIIEIKNGYLLAAFNLLKDGTPSIGDAQIPSDPFFSLVSHELLQSVVRHQVHNNIQGQEFNQSGSEGVVGFSANYHVWGKIRGLSVSTTSNPLKLHANASIDMSASAGIDTPVGVVVDAIEDAGKAVSKAAEDVVKVIINRIRGTLSSSKRDRFIYQFLV